MAFSPKNLLITGGAGFIGSAMVRRAARGMAAANSARIVVLDALTYAGHRVNLEGVAGNPIFVEGNICDAALVNRIVREHAIDSVLHLAAETHVDRSIESANLFVETNVTGTLTLLNACLSAWNEPARKNSGEKKFVHVSTDEVFGALGETGAFTETTPYAPNSPYAASKAASDLLARAFFKTYALPVVITNTCNNYGPRQLPEKLIPLIVKNALDGKKLPVYGKGQQVREWLHVDDHCEGLWRALEDGVPGESYNFGSGEESNNLALVERLCDSVDRLSSQKQGTSRALITFVEDRLGHDFRYAIDSSKAKTKLGWSPTRTLANDLDGVVGWYKDNVAWRETVASAEHERFQKTYYRARGGAS